MLLIFKRAFWLFGLAVLLLVLFLPGYTKLQELRDKNQDLEAKIERLNLDNSSLREDLRRLSEDPVYKEKIVREKMGVVRKGEIPIKIIPEEE